MQQLEVSGAVRPLKWSLGVKWLIYVVFLDGNKVLLYYYDTTAWRPLKK